VVIDSMAMFDISLAKTSAMAVALPPKN